MTLPIQLWPTTPHTSSPWRSVASSGTLLWTEQLGTSDTDAAQSVAVDAFGNAFISGMTGGDLGGTILGDFDAFLTKYDPDGTLLWIEQVGTNSPPGTGGWDWAKLKFPRKSEP